MKSSDAVVPGIRLSARTAWDTGETAWAQAMTQRRTAGLAVHDLTEANPTRCVFAYDQELLAALQRVEALTYAPDPRGLLTAREGVCDYYADHVASLPLNQQGDATDLTPDHLMLTSSTSEAYSYLFRLLCDVGDEILIAQPSYPLFDFLAVLDGVHLKTYSVFYDHGWHLDHHALESAITPRTRAIVLVHPNNPTGHFTHSADRITIEQLCRTHGLALIIDEVFLDYSFSTTQPSFVTAPHPVLTFVLSGLSKVVGLPQMKLAWIAVLGPDRERLDALRRLEVIADTFLSVNTPVQYASRIWLQHRSEIQQQIRARVKNNLHLLDSLLRSESLVDRLDVEGGWYAILNAPAHGNGEETALQLLLRYGVAIHPGSYYGMSSERQLVISLLPPPEVFSIAIQQLLTFLNNPDSNAG